MKVLIPLSQMYPNLKSEQDSKLRHFGSSTPTEKNAKNVHGSYTPRLELSSLLSEFEAIEVRGSKLKNVLFFSNCLFNETSKVDAHNYESFEFVRKWKLFITLWRVGGEGEVKVWYKKL